MQNVTDVSAESTFQFMCLSWFQSKNTKLNKNLVKGYTCSLKPLSADHYYAFFIESLETCSKTIKSSSVISYCYNTKPKIISSFQILG